MFFQAAACVLSLLASSTLAAPGAIAKRDSTNVTIYAYGTGISGLPVYGGPNGTAYVAESPLSSLTYLNWTIASSGDSSWNVTLNATASSAPKGEFYIVTSDDAYEAAGFTSPNTTAPTGAETVGFTTYGTFVMFSSDSSLLSQFWAQETDTDGLWTLMWNSNGESQNNSVPVTLKLTAPSS